MWKSHDGVIRLIDYDDKDEANEMITKLKNLLYKENNMDKKTFEIIFKDNTSATVKIKEIRLGNIREIWLGEIIDDIKNAMVLELPYILHCHNLDSDNQNDYDDTLDIPIKNIKNIREL